ncbi:hypothetical protein VNI00_012116 [Paramarasmius palmivorus]|uniref:HNH nuclease domain-containing protein n=1 Tax=Paramarasmius palmivorus TaxID=297713 RepID=A0AAW0C7X9_9AGAR
MTALPQDNPSVKGLRATALSAYNVCLKLEELSKTKTEQERIQARVLVKKYKGRTPPSSYHPSRPSSDKDKEKMELEIKEAPKDHKEAKRQALIRDGFKCVVTGIYDRRALQIPDIKTEAKNKRHPAGTVYTECVIYISTTTVDLIAPRKKYSASVLAVLKRFGYDVDRLNGEKVHSLFNVMTMEKNIHDAFDRLELWFEATEIKDCYRVETVPEYDPDRPPTIMFTSTSVLPAPSPELLALHAACAKVAHLSGAAAYIDELDEDTDDLPVLAHDGGSYEVFEQRYPSFFRFSPPFY